MTNETMSQLRRRMIEDMTIRNFGPKTHHDYIRSVRNLTVFLGRSPDTASNEDVRRFQLRLSSEGVSAGAMSVKCRFCCKSQLRKAANRDSVLLTRISMRPSHDGPFEE
jgi:Phage integrase, N-terminal SAM-like domain